jgi:hypothetical protein
MTKEMVAHYALKDGLNVPSQRVVDWTGAPKIECLTPSSGPANKRRDTLRSSFGYSTCAKRRMVD